MRTYGLKALGLSLMAAIGLMAFTATAQAIEVLELIGVHLAILLNSGTFLKTGTTTAVSGTQVGTVTLKIPAKNAEIRCEKGTASEGSAENEADTAKNPEGEELTKKSESGLSAMGKAKFQFSKCKVFEEKEGKELTKCTEEFNKNNGEKNEAGTEATPSVKTLLLFFLHFHKWTNNGTLVLEHHIWILRETSLAGPGTALTTLKFGGTCSLPEKVEIKGSLATEVPKTDAVKQTATFDTGSTAGKAVNADAKSELKFGANPSFFKGTFEAELATGGVPWGGM